jgi:hypothetical protein
MLVNVFVIAFVIAYIAIAVYGHVLLITAIWPNLLRRRPEPHSDSIADPRHGLNQPG